MVSLERFGKIALKESKPGKTFSDAVDRWHKGRNNPLRPEGVFCTNPFVAFDQIHRFTPPLKVQGSKLQRVE